ncbi:MAG TPA: choice-of-anchor I family protein, partial [Candidatus Paenibacillus intestinavium]|nr:choice-of-anchor I family protein [Candidatus Paenibacillus intestinavium]
MVAGIAAAGLLLTTGQPHNVLAEQPPFFQYKGENLRAAQIAQYDSLAGLGGTEILAYDEKLQRDFVTNGAESAIDILSFEALKSGEFTDVKSSKRLYLKDFGIEGVSDITSVAAHPTEDIIALSVVSKPKTDPGYIVLLTKTGDFITQVKVGALPDMVAFTPDGTKLLSANEGEPSDDYTVDPEGTISIIDLTTGLDSLTAQTLSFEGVELDKNVRVGSKGTVLQQLEPEYIAVSPDSKRAFVALQENNAVAMVNLETDTIMYVKGLGVKDHSISGNELDAKRDDKTIIESLPLLGFYMPDAIDTFSVGGKTYILTPNEGDARDYEAYSEEASIEDIADKIQLNAHNYAGYTQKELDQLVADGLLDDMKKTKITLENGLVDGKYEALYSYGGRSFSIFDADTMKLVYDSGSEFERITAEALPTYFNTSNDEISYDKRSGAKGPEPETVVTGVINDVTYAFVALERISGIMVYDLTNPASPEFTTLISSRDYGEDVKGDVSPEGLRFIPAETSPTGYPLLAATHEVSGTVAVYEFGGKEIAKPKSFKNVDKNHWAFAYMNDLYQRDIMIGVSDNSFAPQQSVTQVEFAVMLARTLGLSLTSDKFLFTDVPEWAAREVQALVEVGIIEGSGSFHSNEVLTREQMAVMLIRAYEYKTQTTIQVTKEQVYKDDSLISQEAKSYVQKASQLGMMQGSANKFSPKVASTRAHAAKVLSLLAEK